MLMNLPARLGRPSLTRYNIPSAPSAAPSPCAAAVILSSTWP